VLEEEGRSANTIRQAKVVLCAMFGMAVADGYVDYNPIPRREDPQGTRAAGHQGGHAGAVPDGAGLPSE
jgi:hypothetical protein